ncbi:MAG: diacylglycerol/polyprenol kinase family protein [Candidatus Hodarchaeota archaeon]
MQLPFPTLTDLLVLAIAYTWVVAILVIGEGLRRWRNYHPAMTRKFIHLGAGFSVFTVPFYTHSWAAIIVAVSFLVLIYLASPKSPVKGLRSMFEVMAREEDYLSGHIWGPFFYAVSITLLVSVFTLIPSLTPLYPLPAMGLTAMYLGDGIAPFIGAKYGKHWYRIGKATRSIEGSLSVFAASFIGSWICWLFLDVFSTNGLPVFSLLQIITISLMCASSAMLLEGLSPAGWDNLSVPLLATIILVFTGLLIYPMCCP